MRKRIISALLAVCLFLTILPNLALEAQATTTEAPGMAVGRASGTVTDASTGFKLSGVTVNAYTSSGTLKVSTTTNSDGKYKLETDPGGVFTLEFSRSGYTTGRLERVSLGVIETTHDMRLTPGSGGSITPGEIVDSGICGTNVSWALDRQGLLRIKGMGMMRDFPYLNPPWENYSNQITSVIIENGVTRLGKWAFRDCVNLTNVSIANTVSVIGEAVFWNCISLKNITIPSSVERIGGCAFCDCAGLTTVTLPDSVTSIDYGAFNGCTSLASITIPNSVISLATNAFEKCSSLIDVYYSGTAQEWKKLTMNLYETDALTSATIHFTTDTPATPIPPISGTPTPTPLPSPKPTPGDNTKLQSLASNWETAYTSYTEAIRKKLSASAQVNLKAGSLKQLAEKFEASLGEKYGLQVATIGLTKDDRLLVYRALLKMMSEYVGSEMVSFGDISTSDLDKIPTKIVKKVANALKNTSYQYVEGSTKVNIELMDYSGAKWGSATIIKPKQLYPTTTMFSSKSTAVENILKDYTKELLDFDGALVAQAAQEAYKELLKNLFGKSIDSLTSNYIKNKVSKFAPQLKKMGLGDVPSGLNNCCNYYKFIKKIKSGDGGDLLSMLDGTKDISFSDPSIEDNLTKQAMKNLDRIRQEIEKAVKGEATTPESYLGKLIGGIFNFKCPVSVTVFDSAGSQVGYVGDDNLWHDDSIYIEKNGDVKTVYTNGAVSFKITGTDYGTLNCTYEEYENGTPTQRINYYDIPIETGKELSATVSADGKNVVVREAGGQTLSPNETVPAADYQKSTVSIAVNASGGDVQGAGKYVKGDSVQLLASPKTGYRFIGWQNQDGSLVEISPLYEFTAKDDLSLTAVFSRDTTQHNFTDVALDAWYAESIQYAYENGLMAGTSETTFSPGSVTTRGQLVTILYRMEGEPPVNNTDKFDDVPAGQWYTNAVAWAADNGIVSGYGNRKYGPHDGITREQMVTILHRYADIKKVDISKTTNLEKYTDQGKISTYAVASMKWAVAEGLITGTSQTTLSPSGTSTRAQVAAILQRYGEKFPTAE